MNVFKPSKQEKLVVSIRIDSETLKTIDKLSFDADISRNEFINQCINYALENLDKDK